VIQRKKKRIKDKKQSARFVEIAERIELVGNPEEVFEKAVKKIVKAKSKNSTK
jgi:hypothetical protein